MVLTPWDGDRSRCEAESQSENMLQSDINLNARLTIFLINI